MPQISLVEQEDLQVEAPVEQVQFQAQVQVEPEEVE
jgi:hypothetical protein